MCVFKEMKGFTVIMTMTRLDMQPRLTALCWQVLLICIVVGGGAGRGMTGCYSNRVG